MKIIHHKTSYKPRRIHVSYFELLKEIDFYPITFKWGKTSSCDLGQWIIKWKN